MTCAHCGMNCTHQGEDMSLETWAKVKEGFLDEIISIGGGEPTLHPFFWQILGESIANCSDVWLATNGSQTQIAISLAKMARQGIIGCDLSLDDYHDPIDQIVIDAFSEGNMNHLRYDMRDNPNDCRSIRNVTGKEIRAGRCDWGEDRCICEGMVIHPNGDIAPCGCLDAPVIGSVWDEEFEFPDDYSSGCWKENHLYEVA